MSLETTNDEDHCSGEQMRALQLFRSGKNIFLTGPGGTGKSWLLHLFYRDAVARKRDIGMTSMTGAAAAQLSCDGKQKTLHAWSGLNRFDQTVDQFMDSFRKSSQYQNASKWEARKRWLSVDVLVVDEVSMLSWSNLQLLEGVARKMKRNNLPMGGIQLVFSGDFCQLPPVVGWSGIGDSVNPAESGFCFECPFWDVLFPLSSNVELRTPFRQRDPSFFHLLSAVRLGEQTAEHNQQLLEIAARGEQSKVGQAYLDREPALVAEGEPEPCLIITRKDEVSRRNRSRFNSLPGSPVEFGVKYYPVDIYAAKILKRDPEDDDEAGSTLVADCTFVESNCYSPAELAKMIEFVENFVKSQTLFETNLSLKVGARVMQVKNQLELGLTNGSQGVVLHFTTEGFPCVRFDNGVVSVVQPATIPHPKCDGVFAKQLPLVLAWATTVHKSQGSTMDFCLVDGSNHFAAGQLYVALSRARTLEGLILVHLELQSIRCHPKVVAFYRRLREFAEKTGVSSSESDPATLWAAFLSQEKEDKGNNVASEIPRVVKKARTELLPATKTSANAKKGQPITSFFQTKL